MKRIFRLGFMFGDSDEILAFAKIELDQKVIEQVDDSFRAYFYNLHTPEEIAAHVGRNLCLGMRLTSQDGWANLEDDMAKIVSYPNLDQWHCEAQESKQ